jgi:putative colanic acid biosynthesis UDP-glucose lipid carrier transferase
MLHSKKLIRIFSDFVALNLALFLTNYFLFRGFNFISNQESKIILSLVNLLWFSTLFNSNRLYGRFEYVTFKDEIKNVIWNFLSHFFVFSILYAFIFKKIGTYFIYFYGIFFIFLLIGRFLLKLILPKFSRVETLNYIIAGYCHALPKIEKTLYDTHLGKTNYIGSFGKTSDFHKIYLGTVNQIYDFLKTTKVNLVLYASNEMSPSDIHQFMNYARLHFIDFKIIPLEIDLLTEGVKLELHDGFPLLSVKDENIARIRNRFLKRVFDIFFSLLVIIFILSWLFPIISALIRLESKGAPIFIQDRVGFRENIFQCFKFRSMTVQENSSVVEQAKQNDSRITKIGAFIRKTNIDEMPQFFNVLIGNMSVVGPRPHAVSHDVVYKNTTENYILRHYTKPGITGWAQVNGWRGPTDTKEKIVGRTQYDLWYLRNWSFWLDIKIIFLTVFGSKVKENAF